MAVNNPEPAYFWDYTTNSWRKAVVGEAGEYVWNDTAQAWEFGAIGAEYLYNKSTNSWDFGPGGMYVRSGETWVKNTTRGGGPYYWVEGAGWTLNTGVGAVGNDLLLETGDHLLLENGSAILMES